MFLVPPSNNPKHPHRPAQIKTKSWEYPIPPGEVVPVVEYSGLSSVATYTCRWFDFILCISHISSRNSTFLYHFNIFHPKTIKTWFYTTFFNYTFDFTLPFVRKKREILLSPPPGHRWGMYFRKGGSWRCSGFLSSKINRVRNITSSQCCGMQ